MMQPMHFPEHRHHNVIHSRMLRKEELEREKIHYMNSSYTTHFTKFRAMPKIHTTAVKVIKCMEIEGLTAKGAVNHLQLISLDRTEKILVNIAQRYGKVIDYLIKKIKLLEDCPFLDIHAIRVLIGQLLWGHQNIPLGTLETTNLLYYEADVKEEFLEADAILHHTYDSYVSKLPTYVRVNTLSISLEQCINAFCKEGWNLIKYPNTYSHYVTITSLLKENEFIRDIHISELLVFPPGTSFYNHPGYLKGKFVLQDKGSCLASFLLNPKPGSVVLDMCAAPGKTTNHLANIINNEGIVYAAENHPHRYNKLYSFLELTNARCAQTMLSDNMQVKIDNLNYVLIDGPSTYTGIFYKRPRAGLGRKFRQYFHASFKTLVYALQNYTTAKRIVYSSCTNYPEEGEKVVQQALAKVGDSYSLLDIKELLWNEWISVGRAVTHCGNFPLANKCLRTNPDIDKCHGYFIAVFERNFEVPVPPYAWRTKEPKDFYNANEDETDDETLNDNNSMIPEPAPLVPPEPPLIKKYRKKMYFERLKARFAEKRKMHRSQLSSRNSQTSTTANQNQNRHSGSQPFYEIKHSQLYP